jgi:hypothetical protein
MSLLTACAPTIPAPPPTIGGCIEIHPDFIDSSDDWTSRITKNAQLASQAMCTPEFLDRVRSWSDFDWTTDSPVDVANRIAHAGVINIKVGFYSDNSTNAIAYENDGGVYFNKVRASGGAGGIGNIVHEAMHVIGYKHFWNWPWLQGNTVPWRIGGWVDEAVERQSIK